MPEKVNGAPGSICLVPSDLNYLYRNGGIGTYFWFMAHLLARHHWRVHILYGGPVDDRQALAEMPGRLARAGISFSCLEDYQLPQAHRISPNTPAWYAHLSDSLRFALEELDRVHRFDLIEFGDLNCYGFRTVQAKQAGSAFHHARIIVKLHGTSQWLREGNHTLMEQLDDPRRDFCERYAFEHAGIQMAPCRYMLDYVRSTGWNVRADARVIPYAYPEPRYREAGATGAEPRELVFFGRLETRKGLEIFLQAAQQLDPRIALTFLGRDTVLGTGMAASELIRSQLKGRRFSLRTDYNQEQAVQYLREGRRLAVISSLSDNFPNTVIECLVNGIPFVASAVGGIPEILTEPELREALLFQPTAPDLVRCLHAYLAAPAERRRSWRDRARQVADPGAHNQRVAEAYAGLLSPSQAVCPAARPEPPLVSVAVSHRNLGAYLPECLAALAGQSYPRLEVLVVDQGSTCPHAVRVFQEQEKLYPQFHFLQQASGAASTRRCGLDRRADAAPLALARGEFFLTLDADQVCTPHLVERLASALARNPHLTALTCYGLGYAETQNPAVDQAIQASRPTAGPYNLAPFENAFGHGPVLFRTRDLRAVGGYESEPDLGEEWVVFHKLAQQGYRTDVVPEYLFAYRCGVRSTAGLGEDLRNHRRALLKHFRVDLLPLAEATGLWDLVITTSRRLAQVNRQAAGPESQTGSDLYHRVQHLERVNEELHREIQRLRGLPAPAPAFRYRLADHLNNTMKKAAPLHYLAKQSCWLAWRAAQQARRLKAWAIPGRRAA